MESDDLDGWIGRFARFPLVQVIDLDAARRTGSNGAMVRYVCERLPCQVGGGVRTIEDARALIDAGARRIIVGSALFEGDRVDKAAAEAFAGAIGVDQLVAAIDSRGGRIAIHGWKTTLGITAVEALTLLEPAVGAFLATLIDGEGRMQGLDLEAALALRRATRRGLIVAGGIRDIEEVDQLHALGIDAVVGMAIYTGRIALDAPSKP